MTTSSNAIVPYTKRCDSFLFMALQGLSLGSPFVLESREVPSLCSCWIGRNSGKGRGLNAEFRKLSHQDPWTQNYCKFDDFVNRQPLSVRVAWVTNEIRTSKNSVDGSVRCFGFNFICRCLLLHLNASYYELELLGGRLSAADTKGAQPVEKSIQENAPLANWRFAK